MEDTLFLLGYAEKQKGVAERLYAQVKDLDLDKYENRYVFALKVQQLFTALEDLFKQVALLFENHLEDPSAFHKGLLRRMNVEVPGVRPWVISDDSFLLLDKLRAFRHFIRHGYDYELDPDELKLIQKKLRERFPVLLRDLDRFSSFLRSLVDQ